MQRTTSNPRGKAPAGPDKPDHYVQATVGLSFNETIIKQQNQYVLLPVGGQYSLGLVVTGQPVDPALNENQAELGILVLQVENQNIRFVF